MENPKSMRGQVVALDAGEKATFSLDRWTYSSIRSCASVTGLELRRQYKIRLDRPSRTVEITRVR